MRIAIIGSRTITAIDVSSYISECDELISGGACGVDACAAEYAQKRGIKMTIFPPCYEKYGRAAPIVRNKQIVDYADEVLAFWDGCSRGTNGVIAYCLKIGKKVSVVIKNV
jgi:hypothetical protein